MKKISLFIFMLAFFVFIGSNVTSMGKQKEINTDGGYIGGNRIVITDKEEIYQYAMENGIEDYQSIKRLVIVNYDEQLIQESLNSAIQNMSMQLLAGGLTDYTIGSYTTYKYASNLIGTWEFRADEPINILVDVDIFARKDTSMVTDSEMYTKLGFNTETHIHVHENYIDPYGLWEDGGITCKEEDKIYAFEVILNGKVIDLAYAYLPIGVIFYEW